MFLATSFLAYLRDPRRRLARRATKKKKPESGDPRDRRLDRGIPRSRESSFAA